MRAQIIGREGARKIVDHLRRGHPLESEAQEIFLAAAAECVEPPRAPRMRRLAPGSDQGCADPAPAHRFGNGERTYHGRVHDSLNSDDPDDRVVKRSRNPACASRVETTRNNTRRFAHAGKDRFHAGEVGDLRDVEFAGCSAPAGSYFLAGGNNCVPVSSSTTVIALTGHARADTTIAASDAPVRL